jgi:hypothetical protein
MSNDMVHKMARAIAGFMMLEWPPTEEHINMLVIEITALEKMAPDEGAVKASLEALHVLREYMMTYDPKMN